MPRATERLTRDSSAAAIKKAISATIAELINAGRDAKQAAAIAYDEAREKTGQSLGKRQKLKGRSTRTSA